jgi:hypothetical protein
MVIQITRGISPCKQALDHSPLAGGVGRRTESQQEPIWPIRVTPLPGRALPAAPAQDAFRR